MAKVYRCPECRHKEKCLDDERVDKCPVCGFEFTGTCDDCGGSGVICINSMTDEYVDCTRCEGKGLVNI